MQIAGPRNAGVSLNREQSGLSPTDKLVLIERWFYGAQVWLKFATHPGRDRPPTEEEMNIILLVYPGFARELATEPRQIEGVVEWMDDNWLLKAIATYYHADRVTPAAKDLAKFMRLTLADQRIFIEMSPQSN